MAVSLQNFINRAERTPDATRIELKGGDHVSAKGTNFLSRIFQDKTGDATVNRATINAFVNAIKAEHGNHIGGIVGNQGLIKEALRDGKPLTPDMIKKFASDITLELKNVRDFNSDKLKAFKADTGPNGMQALVKQLAEEKGMTWFATTRGEVEGLANSLRIPDSKTPHSAESLKQAVTTALNARLDEAETTHARNMQVLAQFEQQAETIINDVFSNPLKTKLTHEGSEVPVKLKNHFSQEELKPLVDFATQQVKELADSSDKVTMDMLVSAFKGTLGFNHASPPDAVLIGSIENRLGEMGVNTGPNQTTEIRGLGVLYGLHTEEGMQQGLTLAKELSGKLKELGAIEDSAKLIQTIVDIFNKAEVTVEGGEKIDQIISFAFKTAMILGNADKQTALAIFDTLNGPAAKALEGPLSTWVDKSGATLPKEFQAIAFGHKALRNAAREAAGLRLADQPRAAAELQASVEPVAIKDIPNNILKEMYKLGFNPITFEGQRLSGAAFQRLGMDTAVQLMKIFPGETMNSAHINIIGNYIKAHPGVEHTPQSLYQALTGAPMPDPAPQSIPRALADKMIATILDAHFPDIPRDSFEVSHMQNNIQTGLELGLTAQQIVDQIKNHTPISMANLPQGALPGLGDSIQLERDYGSIRDQVAMDLHRRTRIGAMPLTFDFGNGVKFQPGVNGANVPEQYKASYQASGIENNLYAKAIVTEVTTLCGGNKAQESAVNLLFTASPLNFMRAVRPMIAGSDFGPLNEHSAFNVTLRKNEDGSITGTLSLPEDHPLYSVKMEYRIEPDGASRMTDFFAGAKNPQPNA